MTSEEQQRVVERYNERLGRLGETPQALGWRDIAQQQLRFRMLTAIGDCSQRRVLDVGCGFGDLLDYLTENGAREVAYTGTDLTPAMIEIARQRHPGAAFHATGDLALFPNESEDYVFMSGLFNYRIEDNLAFLQEMMKQSFRIARLGVAFNLLGSDVDFREEHLFYYRETEVFALAKGLTRFVSLRTDYPLYEFTVHLYKPAAMKA